MQVKRAIILLMAGQSERFGESKRKQLTVINGKEMFLYPLDTFFDSKMFSNIVLVVCDEDIEDVKAILHREGYDSDDFAIVKGGETRNQSVFNAIEFLDAIGFDGDILIHDAVRPCVPVDVISSLITGLDSFDAVTPVLCVSDSVMSSDGEYLDRNNIYRVQTPQAFHFDVLRQIYSNTIDEKSTDDYSKAVNYGYRTSTVTGSYLLMKVTFSDDLKIIEKILA